MKVSFLVLIVFYSAIAFAHAEGGRVVGGPCEYRTYKGKARIVSVKQASENLGGSQNVYEVLFTFDPGQAIMEDFAKPQGKQYTLLRNGSYPGREFVDRHGIEPGKVFECLMKVITKGTCTPVLFEFPSLDAGTF